MSVIGSVFLFVVGVDAVVVGALIGQDAEQLDGRTLSAFLVLFGVVSCWASTSVVV